MWEARRTQAHCLTDTIQRRLPSLLSSRRSQKLSQQYGTILETFQKYSSVVSAVIFVDRSKLYWRSYRLILTIFTSHDRR